MGMFGIILLINSILIIILFKTKEKGEQWIFCDKKLPKNNKEVLVFYSNGFIEKNKYINGRWIKGKPIGW